MRTFIILTLILIPIAHGQTGTNSKLNHLAYPPATSRPPAKLFVGQEVFEVGMLEAEYMNGLDGATFCSKHLIIINVETSEITMRKAFMHEALHAIFCTYPVKSHWWSSNETRRHKDIQVLGPALSELMHDNAYLDRWLQEGRQ